MKKIGIYIATILFFCSSLNADLLKSNLKNDLHLLKKINTSDNKNTNKLQTKGLKEALNIGVDFAINTLKKDGYLKNPSVKIKLPSSMQDIANVVSKLGGKEYVDEFEKDINLAAGEAISKSKPIFVEAIKSLNVHNSAKLIAGEQNSITKYFKQKTSKDLEKTILPIVKKATDKNKLSSSYKKVLNTYNSANISKQLSSFLGEKAKPINMDDINKHITQKTIDGAFKMIEKEEGKIRKNPLSYSSGVIKRVFSNKS